jgi:hypothetical protein
LPDNKLIDIGVNNEAGLKAIFFKGKQFIGQAIGVDWQFTDSI